MLRLALLMLVLALVALPAGGIALAILMIDEVDEAIEWAMSINDRPVLIDFRVSKDSMVWPMVAAGTSNDEIMAARDIRPLFDEDDAADEPAVIHAAMERPDAATLPGEEQK